MNIQQYEPFGRNDKIKNLPKLDSITESHIEKFVGYPDSLSDQERVQIQKAISNSRRMQKFANWFRMFYQLLNEEDACEGKTIGLEALDLSKNTSTSDHNLLLAAKTENDDPGKDKLKTITTLVSESESLLIRVLKDTASGEYRLHLLKEVKPRQDDLNILHLEEENIDIVIDQSRHITLSKSSKVDSIDWRHNAISLKSPVDFIKISKREINLLKNGNSFNKNGLSITVSGKGTGKKLSVEKLNACSYDIRLLVLQADSHEYKIYRFHGQEVVQLNFSSEEILKCWLFN